MMTMMMMIMMMEALYSSKLGGVIENPKLTIHLTPIFMSIITIMMMTMVVVIIMEVSYS